MVALTSRAMKSYGKLQKSSELIGRITLRRALRSGDQRMFDEWLTDMTDMLHAKNKPKAAARLAKVVAHGRRQSFHVWEALREYLEGYFFKEFLGLGLPKVIASASALVCAGSPVVFAARLRQQPLKEQQSFMGQAALGATTTLGSSTGSSVIDSVLPSDSVSQISGSGGSRVAELEARLAAAEAERYADRKDSIGRCKWCLRMECLFISGGKPCREYNQAINFLGEQRAARRAGEEGAQRKPPGLGGKGAVVTPKDGE